MKILKRTAHFDNMEMSSAPNLGKNWINLFYFLDILCLHDRKSDSALFIQQYFRQKLTFNFDIFALLLSWGN